MNGYRAAGGALWACVRQMEELDTWSNEMTSPGFSPPGMVALAEFDELAMPLFHSLYNFARWLAQNPNDAEDLVQETYLKALRGFDSFQPGSNFQAWIFRILKNTFLDLRSKPEQRMTQAMDSEEDLPPTCTTPESLLIGRSETDAVRCAIEQLPVAFREVILLYDMEEASYREIAEILSIPMGTVMSRLSRARTTVRESLRGRSHFLSEMRRATV